MRKKVYIGDSVYATCDDDQIILTTENGLPGDPSNEIYLDFEVLSNLFNCWELLKAKVL